MAKKLANLLEDKDKVNFSNELLESFDKLGLGGLSKADLEAYLYYLIKKHKSKNQQLSKFDWVRLLKITPSKLNSMQTLSSVKFETLVDKKSEIFEDLVSELSKHPIEVFNADQQLIRLLISDMHIKLFIESYADDKGYAIKYERNKNALIIQLKLFLELLDDIEKYFKKDLNLRNLLINDLKEDIKSNELKDFLKSKKKFTTYFAEKLGNAAENKLYTTAIGELGIVVFKIINQHLINN